MDINFELYKIFYQAAKAGSFSEAADRLFISQSAVSQSIKNLEAQMGQQLFSRKTRNAKLTCEGEVLFSHIEQAYNFIKAGESKIEEMKNIDSGIVRIGAGDTICKYYLIPFLQNFNSLYPGIKIQVVNRTTSGIITALKNGVVDIGIATLPVLDDIINIQHFRFAKDIFVASKKYAELAGKKTDIGKLAEYPLLMLEKNTATRRNIDNFLTENNVHTVPEIELESVDLLVEFAKIGLGIAHVLYQSAQGSIQNGDLFEVHTKQQLPIRELGIITMRNVPLSNAASAFIQKLGEIASSTSLV